MCDVKFFVQLDILAVELGLLVNFLRLLKKVGWGNVVCEQEVNASISNKVCAGIKVCDKKIFCLLFFHNLLKHCVLRKMFSEFSFCFIHD